MKYWIAHFCLLAVCILAGISPLSAQDSGQMSVKAFYLKSNEAYEEKLTSD